MLHPSLYNFEVMNYDKIRNILSKKKRENLTRQLVRFEKFVKMLN